MRQKQTPYSSGQRGEKLDLKAEAAQVVRNINSKDGVFYNPDYATSLKIAESIVAKEGM